MKMADSSSDFVSSVKKKKNGNDDRKPLFNCGPVFTSKLKGDLKNVASIRCHQCRKSEKDRYIFRCKSCTKTGYCYPCMLRWYPDMTMEMFTKRCPFCLGNCNCTHCLRQVIPNEEGKAANENTSSHLDEGAKDDSGKTKTQENVEKDATKDLAGLQCNEMTVSQEKIINKSSTEIVPSVAEGDTEQLDAPSEQLTVVDKEVHEENASTVAPKRKRGQPPKLQAKSPGTTLTASERQLETVTCDMNAENLPFVKRTPLWHTIEAMEAFQKIPQNPHFRPLLKGVKESAREGLAIGTMVTFSNVVDRIYCLRFEDPRITIEDCLETLVELESNGFNVEVIRDCLTRLLLLKDKQEELEGRSKGVVEKIEEQKIQEKTINDEVDEIDRQIRQVEEKRRKVLLKKEKWNAEVDAMKAAEGAIEQKIIEVAAEFDGLAAAPL